MPAFKEVVKKTNVVKLVMCAIIALEGEHAVVAVSHLSNICGRDPGFSGYVVSDCGAIRDFYTDHKITASPARSRRTCGKERWGGTVLWRCVSGTT